MSVLPGCVQVHHMRVWCLGRLEEGARSPRLELQFENNHLGAGIQPGPPREQHVFLTTEPSLYPSDFLSVRHMLTV